MTRMAFEQPTVTQSRTASGREVHRLKADGADMAQTDAEPTEALAAVRAWRALAPQEQRALRMSNIRAKVARSMAFEGEPVPQGWIAAMHPHSGAQPEVPTNAHAMPRYAILAPWLADKIAQVEASIATGVYADYRLDEYLLLALHGDICGDLLPEIGGRWRQIDVQVGSHEPPPYYRVAELMHNYALDLVARLADPDELRQVRILETLAFAEGRLLSIHPFADFNGRLTRVSL